MPRRRSRRLGRGRRRRRCALCSDDACGGYNRPRFMRTLADLCIRRPIFASMLILALVVVGAAAYTKLGVDRLPSVDLPSVTIRTTLPGASPEEMETEVSQVIEENVNTVEGIEELRSVSGAGTSFVIVTFGLDRNIEVAAQDVRDRIASIA